MATSGAISALDKFIPVANREQLQRQYWQDYQDHIDLRLKMYKDNWGPELRTYIMSQVSRETQFQFFTDSVNANENPTRKDDIIAPKWPQPITLNLLKQVTKKISLVYNSPANRTFTKQASDAVSGETQIVDSDRFAEIVGAWYNNKMAEVNRLTNLCNLVLVKPVPDINYKGGFRLEIFTPDMFTPIQSINDPSRLIGCLYCIDLTDTPSMGSATRKEVMIYMGEEGEEPFIAEIDNSQYQKAEKKPYPYISEGKKYLPFAVFRNSEPLLGEFVDRHAGRDLYSGTLQAAHLLSLWMRAFKESSGKNILISGPSAGMDATKTFLRDSMNVWIFPFAKEEALIEQIDHQRDLVAHWTALEKYVEQILNNNDLNIDKFKGTVLSGVSLKIQNESIIEKIKGQWPYMEAGETQLAEIIRLENNRTQPSSIYRPIPMDYEFSINFGSLPYEDEPKDRTEVYDWAVRNNYKSQAQVLMEFDPDIKSEEQAQAQLIQNAQKNREISRSLASFKTPTSALATPQTPNPAQPQEPANGSGPQPNSTGIQ